MSTTRRRGRRAVLSAAVVGFCLSGGGFVAFGLSQQESGPPGPGRTDAGQAKRTGAASGEVSAPTNSTGESGPGEKYATPSGTVLDQSRPTAVRVPSLDVDGRTIDLGTTAKRKMEVPQNGSDIGWFKASPTPGELGPSIIAAHVTWKGKRGVFYELGAVKPKARIEVDRRDGTTAIFQVDRVGEYSKAKFPSQQVYGATDRAALRLITCGGAYDSVNQRHVDNIVVYAHLVGSERG